MKFMYALSLITPVHLIALFPVPHSQYPLLVVVLQDTTPDTMSCTDAVHKNNYCIILHSVICALELGSNM